MPHSRSFPPHLLAKAPGRLIRLGVLLPLLIGCQQQKSVETNPDSKAVPTINAATWTVSSTPWPTLIRAQGSLVMDEVAVVGTRVEGLVDQVHVDLGDRVVAGQPLVTLKQEQFQLEVEKAQAQLLQARSAIGLTSDDPLDKLNPQNAPPVRETRAEWEEAESDLARARGLRDGNAITVAEFTTIQTAVDVAKARYESSVNAVREKIALVKVRDAELQLARQKLNDTVIRAEFDGAVQKKEVAPGNYVRPGDSLVTVVRTNPLRFRGSVPEHSALELREGQTLQLDVQMVSSPISVEISRISPSVDLLSRGLTFEAIVPNPEGGLRSGLFAEAEIVIDEDAQAVTIPRTALVEFAGTEKVWKVIDGMCKEQVVLSGERREAGIEILQGLKVGDVILQDGSLGRAGRLADPRAVEPNEELGETEQEGVSNP